MPTSTEDLAVVDEKTWNAWMEKGKLREAARARKMKLALERDGSGRYADAARLLLATATVPPGVAEGRK